jgi:hypothetical protein
VIYAIRAGSDGPIKFGRAKNPLKRLKILQTGHYQKLELWAVSDLPGDCEKAIHGWLREERLCGEWFRPTDKTLDVLSDLQIRQVVGGNQYEPDMDAYEAEYLRRNGRKVIPPISGNG